MRLIDADALVGWLKSAGPYLKGLENHKPLPKAIGVIINHTEAMPTIDAVEVVHGYWFSLTDCSNAGVYCSVCHKKVWREDYAWCNRKNKLRSNYCPNCGAKMDGDMTQTLLSKPEGE